MKILKPGKVEQRKFVCPRCGCVFVAHEDDVSEGYVSCPQEGCGYNQNWERKGEPYEEPTPTQDDDLWRLTTLVYDAPQKHANSWPEAAEYIARHLIAHGVTFREG